MDADQVMHPGPGDNVIPFPGRRTPLHRPVLLPRRETPATFVVRIDLDDAEPPIWRRVRLASDLTLAQLHGILQEVMGWTDSHLHQFTMGAAATDGPVQPFLTPFDEMDAFDGVDEDGIREADVRLGEVLASAGDRLAYTYDFGDNWRHTLLLESVEERAADEPDAVCVAGEQACPPEDVGGIGGYDEILAGLAGADADDEWMAERLAWLPEGFDPAEFSVDQVNQALAAGVMPDLTQWHPAIVDLLYKAGGSGLSPVGELISRATRGPAGLSDEQVAAAVHPYAHLLRTVGDGVRLTAAGYLPPTVMKVVFKGLVIERRWVRIGTREDATFPVLQLRESAVSLGLLRKSRGMLLATKAGQQLADDPRGLWRHIASRLPLGRPEERDAGLLVLLTNAAGDDWYDSAEDGGALLEDLGWAVTGATMRQAAYAWARPTLDVLDALNGWREDAAANAPVAREALRRPEA
ncbi:pRiA4b ORF-3-like protein [Raineyella antarctica]|uniref:PRiA4b ORF-3-like protein n=1 Tax=Raineyella antarctica TaxID=1577474 RepID=A0A1G6I755_9ACTN|nr:plasmid pRiA4b ORF-3 family protein [Raineyella antarctica]SDC02280.1 pRiA4b ORF-3-like protein [Raineyella antarctica]